MGFYTSNKFLYLPNKRTVVDLIERDGPPTKESFTPYNGMNYLIEEQMKGYRYSIIGIDIITDNIAELSVSKLKGTEDIKSEESDDTSLNPDNYEYLLEKIDEEYVKRYLKRALIGLKINKSDARGAIEENEQVQNLMYDKESGEVHNLSDTYVADLVEESGSKMKEIRNKIPYLLKKLQDGSIMYGVSLLSLFIALDGVRQQKGLNSDIKPNDLLAYPIYRVNGHGTLIDTFDPATANNIAKFRTPKDLVLGVNPHDPYYKAGLELISRARRLGYNLYEEDVRDYTPSYINRLMHDYIISNQEVLSDMAVFDPNIMKLFKDGSIFNAPTITEEDVEPINKILKLREMAKQKLCNVPELHYLCDNDKAFQKVLEPVKLINQFFKLYKETNKKSSMEEEYTEDCLLINEVLCNSAMEPLIFKGDMFLPGFGDTPYFNSVYFIITSKGYAVKIDDNPNKLVVTTISSIFLYNECKNIDLFYKKVVNL